MAGTAQLWTLRVVPDTQFCGWILLWLCTVNGVSVCELSTGATAWVLLDFSGVVMILEHSEIIKSATASTFFSSRSTVSPILSIFIIIIHLSRHEARWSESCRYRVDVTWRDAGILIECWQGDLNTNHFAVSPFTLSRLLWAGDRERSTLFVIHICDLVSSWTGGQILVEKRTIWIQRHLNVLFSVRDCV